MSCSMPLNKEVELQRMLPKDCEGQIKMGFTIVFNAYKAKVKGLEDDLRIVSDERGSLEDKLNIATQRIAKYERERLNHVILQDKVSQLESKLMERTAEVDDVRAESRRREAELSMENKRLSAEINALKKKAQQFESFRRVIWETMKNEDDFGENKLPLHSSGFLPQDFPSGGSRTERHGTDTGGGGALPYAPQSYPDTEGRKLFRLAKARLSAEQFERFVDCVRRLNSRAITLEETIAEMESICGYENVALFQSFRDLLHQRKAGNCFGNNSSETVAGGAGQSTNRASPTALHASKTSSFFHNGGPPEIGSPTSAPNSRQQQQQAQMQQFPSL